MQKLGTRKKTSTETSRTPPDRTQRAEYSCMLSFSRRGPSAEQLKFKGQNALDNADMRAVINYCGY